MQEQAAAVADELAIRSLVSRYVDAVYRRNPKDLEDTWAENASWSVLGRTVTGRQQILAFWLQAMAQLPFVAMQMHSGTVEIDGDAATGRWYLSEYLVDRQGVRKMVIGTYADRYVKNEGKWFFQDRRHAVLYQGPADLSGPTMPFPADV